MRNIIFSSMFVIMVFTACFDSGEPEKAVVSAFSNAMLSLQQGDYETYMTHVDFGTDMDSIQRSYVVKALNQHKGRNIKEKMKLDSVNVVKVTFNSDSVCDVFYELKYVDSTREVSMQKMVKVGDDWKIRFRN